MPQTDPGPFQDTSFIEWVLGSAWAILVVVWGLLGKLYLALTKRMSVMEKKQEATDHDLKGVRQNQVFLERMTEKRHEDNQQASQSLQDLLVGQFRSLSERIDRLLERNNH